MILLAGVGMVSGIVNTVVGGGTSLVVPLLIFLGIDPRIANGTNRVCVSFQALTAGWVLRRKSDTPIKNAFAPAVAALLGSIPGAWLATIIDPESFRRILGVLLLLGVAFFFLKPPRSSVEDQGADSVIGFTPLLVTFGMGIYGGFLGAGIGVLLLLYLTPLLALPTAKIVEIKVWIVLALSVASGSVFVATDNVDYHAVSVLLPAYICGGWIGGNAVLRSSERWLRRVVAIVAALLAIAVLTDV